MVVGFILNLGFLFVDVVWKGDMGLGVVCLKVIVILLLDVIFLFFGVIGILVEDLIGVLGIIVVFIFFIGIFWWKVWFILNFIFWGFGLLYLCGWGVWVILVNFFFCLCFKKLRLKSLCS